MAEQVFELCCAATVDALNEALDDQGITVGQILAVFLLSHHYGMANSNEAKFRVLYFDEDRSGGRMRLTWTCPRCGYRVADKFACGECGYVLK